MSSRLPGLIYDLSQATVLMIHNGRGKMVTSGKGTGSQVGVGKEEWWERGALFSLWKGQWLRLQSPISSAGHRSFSLLLGILVEWKIYTGKRYRSIFLFLSRVLTRQVSPALEWIINYWCSLYNKYVFCKWEASTLEAPHKAAWRTGGEAWGKVPECRRQTDLGFGPCFLSPWSWGIYLTFLSLRFLIYRIGMIVISISQSWWKSKLN